MEEKRYHPPGSSSNILWLTFAGQPTPLMIRSQLLGLGPDHSLLCALPENPHVPDLEQGTMCRGRSLLDGETYQFETTVRETLGNPPALRLNAPNKITRHTPRIYPRLPVDFSGTIRPLSENGRVLAVLPVTLHDLCPTGCQVSAPASAWPNVSTMQVFLACKLPGSPHSSKFSGTIEWIDPTPDLHMGLKFQFSSDADGARQDLHRWFTSQKAKIINTVA